MNDQNKFVPERATIARGGTVTWKNVGTVVHTATANPAKALDKSHAKLLSGAQPWDSGLIEGGTSWSRTFDTPGEYTYFCIPHEAVGMVATLTVTG